MGLGEPSRTAVNTAMWRAVPTLFDERPKVLADALADRPGATDEALAAYEARL